MTLSCHVPKGNLGIAFSGGPDSIYAANYFLKDRSRKITLFHVNHGTEHSDEAEHFVRNWCCFKDVELVVHRIRPEKPKDQSWEEFWRNERYEFFHAQKMPIITGHNLDDVIETYLFTTFHGKARIMPYQNGNVIRPFLYVTKAEMRANVEKCWIDPTNEALCFARNRIRHNIMPDVRKINPGIETTVKKLMRKEYI